jgi:hypothetical protein
VDAQGAASISTLLDVRVYQPPVFEGYPAFMTALNTRASVALSKILNRVSHSDGGSINITGASALSSQGGTVTLDSDNVNYTPPAGYIGADTFTVTISDTSGGTINVTLTVNVTDASEGSSSNGSNLAIG